MALTNRIAGRNWQLPISYVGFFLPAGVLLSYLPPFLKAKGLTHLEVGLIFSAVFGVKLVMGPLLAWWADAAHRQLRALWIAAWLSVAAAILLGSSRQFGVLFVSVVCISVCRNYFQCMLEALATRIKDGGGVPRYGLMRAFGSASVCFGIVLFGGLWSASEDFQQIVLPLMIFVSGFVLVICLHSTRAATNMVVDTLASQELSAELLTPTFSIGTGLLLAGATLLIGANGVFYSSATLLMQDRGLTAPGIAWLWFATFAVEALGFTVFDQLRQRWQAMKIFLVVIVLASFRWLLFSHATSIELLLLAFVLHVASFSWTHALLANWVRDICPTRYAATGQAIYIACAHGIGLAGASFIASNALPIWGANVFWFASAMTICGAALIVLRSALRNREHSYKNLKPA